MIRLIDIYKTYDNGTKALKGINLRIDDGEFAFLVGPSGSGKSTIIKLLTAEVAPTDGRLMVNGYIFWKLHLHLLKSSHFCLLPDWFSQI